METKYSGLMEDVVMTVVAVDDDDDAIDDNEFEISSVR